MSVVEANVSDSGTINLRIRIEKNGAYELSDLMRSGTTETLLGVNSIGQGVGTFTNVFETDEPSSVQFLAKEGETVFIPAGTEKELLQFTPRGEKKGVAARYAIRVCRAITENEKIVPAGKSTGGARRMMSGHDNSVK